MRLVDWYFRAKAQWRAKLAGPFMYGWKMNYRRKELKFYDSRTNRRDKMDARRRDESAKADLIRLGLGKWAMEKL
jgi:hypothetical protein